MARAGPAYSRMGLSQQSVGGDRYLVYHSPWEDGTTYSRIYFYDLDTSNRELLSQGVEGAPVDGHSFYASISRDGRYVAFESEATNLVTGDGNGLKDVFLHDRSTGSTVRVSRGLLGEETDGESYDAVVAPDGNLVVFASKATNLVNGDSNGVADIFVYDIAGGDIIRVNGDESGNQVMGSDSDQPALFPDGKWIVYASAGTNLPGANGVPQLYATRPSNGKLFLVSQNTSGESANGACSAPTFGGRSHLSFTSEADNLVADDNNGVSDVFIMDKFTKEISLASRGVDGMPLVGPSRDSVVNGDGSKLAFVTETGGGYSVLGTKPRVVLRDLGSGANKLVSHPEQPSDGVGISESGEDVFFGSSLIYIWNPNVALADVHHYRASTQETWRLDPPALAKLEIEPRALLAAPGTTRQVTCWAVFDDTTREDWTERVDWTSLNPTKLQVSNLDGSKGTVTIPAATSTGDSGSLRASYLGNTVDLSVRFDRFVYAINPAPPSYQANGDGSLTGVFTSTFPGPPSFLAVHRSGLFVLVVSHTTDTLYSYRITSDGTPQLLDSRRDGATANMIFLRSHPSKPFLFGAGTAGLTSFYVDDSGALPGKLNSFQYEVDGQFQRLAIDPERHFVYAATLDGTVIKTIGVDYYLGSLYPQPGHIQDTGLQVASSGVPADMEVEPRHGYLCVATYNNDRLRTYSINDDTGQLTLVDEVSLAAKPLCLEVHQTLPYLYLGSEDDTLRTFTVDADGNLSEVTSVASNQPRHAVMDPTGQFLYVTDSEDDDLISYRTETDGSLTFLSAVDAVFTTNFLDVTP